MTVKASLAGRVGTVLDNKWRLTEVIGEGGMAAVYGACHIRNGGAVAIKILSPESAADVPLAARFLSEGYVANRVGHKGCVRVLDDGRTPEGVPYIVMERLTGATLDSTANGGALPIDDVLRYGIALAEVLAAAHAAEIVHRDIKPENVFLCDDGAIKVLDFGIAQLKGLAQEARITVAGQTLGTPAFMPPEQVMGQWDRVGPASDVYAAGGTLFNLLTGSFPHLAETAQEFMVRAATQQARPVRSLRPEIPPAFAEVIDRALSHAPEGRYQNGTALLEALRAVSEKGRLETMRSPLVAVPAATARAIVPLETKSPVRLSTAPVSSSSRDGGRKKSWTAPLAIGFFAALGIGAGVATYASVSKPPRDAAMALPSGADTQPVAREAATTAAPEDRSNVSVSPGPTAPHVAADDTPRPIETAEPSARPTASPQPVGGGPAASSHAPQPPGFHEVATARPQATSTPTAVQRPPPDPSDPLGFH